MHIAMMQRLRILRMLEHYPELLKFEGCVTDYSGRTFHCTAYKYAYGGLLHNMTVSFKVDRHTCSSMLIKNYKIAWYERRQDNAQPFWWTKIALKRFV